jgi:uncharacterized protein
VLVTQQPGAIPDEIPSQGDNWFLFHLLAGGDLTSARKTNAHFSNDILSSLLNEPIPGQGVFWSSSSERPYPIALRVKSFEDEFKMLDPNCNRGAVPTFARKLRGDAARVEEEARKRGFIIEPPTDGERRFPDADQTAVDLRKYYEELAREAIEGNGQLMNDLHNDGVPWGLLNAKVQDRLPATLDDRIRKAYELVPPTLTAIFGDQGVGWHSFPNPRTGKRWVKAGPKPR